LAVDANLSEHRRLVTRILRSIPTHLEQPRSIADIASRAGEGLAVSPDHLVLGTSVVLAVLGAFDVLTEQSGGYRCRGEMPMHFVRSFTWYIDNARPLVENWARPGVGDDITISALLGAAPYLLKIAEEKRLELAGPEVEQARDRRVACVLVKTIMDGRSHFLFEWDRRAAQYQLIGGRINDGEQPESTAAQELMEEVATEAGHRLEPGRHFDISPLTWDRSLPLRWTGVSRTVGALTRYQVWAYGASLKVGQLKLREHCRWLSIDEMLAGETESGRRTGDPKLYEIMNVSLAGGLAAVPISIRSEAVPGFRRDASPTRDGPTSVFIGHGRSSAWRVLADHLRDHHGYPVITYDSEPRAGQATTDVLTRLVKQAGFAILVHTAEDEQAGGGLRARQNVVHETGLFQGRLGFSRAIIVRQRGCDAFSNLAGLHELHYTADIKEAFGEVVAALRREFG
jgi:8-oxo-dGTP pyrophosphatase MutT (NUDIX family)